MYLADKFDSSGYSFSTADGILNRETRSKKLGDYRSK